MMKEHVIIFTPSTLTTFSCLKVFEHTTITYQYVLERLVNMIITIHHRARSGTQELCVFLQMLEHAVTNLNDNARHRVRMFREPDHVPWHKNVDTLTHLTTLSFLTTRTQ